MGQRLGHAHLRRHGHIVRRGHRARGAFGIGGQPQDVLPFDPCKGRHELLTGFLIQMMVEVRPLVGGHALKKPDRHVPRQERQERILPFRRKINEDFRALLFFHLGKYLPDLPGRQGLQRIGQIGRMDGAQDFRQISGAGVGKAVNERGAQQFTIHDTSPFCRG